MDHLWRHGKERICANRQYASIEEQVHHFLHYLEGLSVLLIVKILYAVHDFTTDFVAKC